MPANIEDLTINSALQIKNEMTPDMNHILFVFKVGANGKPVQGTQGWYKIQDLITAFGNEAGTKIELLEQVATEKTVELNTYTSTKKNELNTHTSQKKTELDNHTNTKKDELDTYETSKESELNTYTVAKKQELDTYESSKEEELNTYTTTKRLEITSHTETKKNELSAIMAQVGLYDSSYSAL